MLDATEKLMAHEGRLVRGVGRSRELLEQLEGALEAAYARGDLVEAERLEGARARLTSALEGVRWLPAARSLPLPSDPPEDPVLVPEPPEAPQASSATLPADTRR